MEAINLNTAPEAEIIPFEETEDSRLKLLQDHLRQSVALSQARKDGLAPALLLLTRCTKDPNDEKGKRSKSYYEVIEFWKDGVARTFLLREDWVRETGLGRRDETGFAAFAAYKYQKVSVEYFGLALCEWMAYAKVPEKNKEYMEIFLKIAQGEWHSLDLAGNEEPRKPFGM